MRVLVSTVQKPLWRDHCITKCKPENTSGAEVYGRRSAILLLVAGTVGTPRKGLACVGVWFGLVSQILHSAWILEPWALWFNSFSLCLTISKGTGQVSSLNTFHCSTADRMLWFGCWHPAGGTCQPLALGFFCSDFKCRWKTTALTTPSGKWVTSFLLQTPIQRDPLCQMHIFITAQSHRDFHQRSDMRLFVTQV